MWLFTSSILVHGFDISLSGTVKDDLGKPVADAKVTTTYYQYSKLADKVATMSDSLGRFNLEVTNLSITNQERFYLNAITQFSVKNNMLEFTSSSQVISGQLEVLSIDGKKLFSVPLKRANRGRQSLTLPVKNSFGLYILKLNVNGTIYSGNLLCLGMWNCALTGLEYKQSSGKSAQISDNASIDTLIVTKKNFIDSRMPINSYKKTEMNETVSGGVLRTLFGISDTMITGWNPGKSTTDSSFTLWNTSDIYSNIDGGGVKYVVNGMRQMADLCMTGQTNQDGSIQQLVPQSSFIMDFGTDNTAKKMYQFIKNDKYDSDALNLDGYSDSVVFITPSLSGITLFSYYKQFYFELCLNNFVSTESAVAAGKVFLEHFISRVK
jgi:hypothetical protein